MIPLLVPVALATTLEEVVARAAEVDPDAVVAQLEWKRDRVDAVEAWSQLGPSPAVSVSKDLLSDTPAAGALSVSVGLLEPGTWMDAVQESAQARVGHWVADATTLDVQYAAALLYYEALSAEAGLAAAKVGEELAQATVTATRARVAAGLESEILGKSADIGLLQAQADRVNAEADVAITRARLARAIEQEIGDLAPAQAPALPAEEPASPWLRAAEAEVDAARMEHWRALAEILPEGDLRASRGFADTSAWRLTAGATWRFDGVIGPFARARSAAIDKQIAEVEAEGLDRDLTLLLTTAKEQANAATKVAEAARAREKLAEETLRVGQTRLQAGLTSSLEVLRLQDEAAQARADRVAAELAEALARLEARRVAGVKWETAKKE